MNTPICLCEDDSQQQTNCNDAFSCGSSNLSNLKYPFWGGNREQYCGVSSSPHPEMELTCESSVSKITLNEIKNRILNWDNTTQMLKVTRDDYWGPNLCAILTDHYKNTTFDNTLFQRVSDQIANVMFIYNCVSNGNLLSQFYNITCGGIGGDTTVVYIVADLFSVPCSGSVTVVTIPLLGTQASTLVTQYSGGDFVERGRCIDSGGVCGKDGPHTTTSCNSQTNSSTPSGL